MQDNGFDSTALVRQVVDQGASQGVNQLVNQAVNQAVKQVFKLTNQGVNQAVTQVLVVLHQHQAPAMVSQRTRVHLPRLRHQLRVAQGHDCLVSQAVDQICLLAHQAEATIMVRQAQVTNLQPRQWAGTIAVNKRSCIHTRWPSTSTSAGLACKPVCSATSTSISCNRAKWQGT